jgi:hypothetical protein
MAAASTNSPPTPGSGEPTGPLGRGILAVLNRHHVDYLVIGAFAAIAQGALHSK